VGGFLSFLKSYSVFCILILSVTVNATYVGGNPMSKIDPYGLSDMDVFPRTNPRDNLYLYDNFTQNMPGFFSFGAHGQPRALFDQAGKRLTPLQVAALIKSHPGYKSGQAIQLNACNAGTQPFDSSQIFAQQLANIMGVDVMAPNNTLWFNSAGNLNVNNLGDWVFFSPSPIPMK
jgi:hypothetical protein